MTRTSVQALSVARPLVRGLMVLNIVYALAIAVLLVWSFFIAGAIVHAILRRLLAIVDTVRVGDPFILDNAQRLEAIAWRVLGLEGLRIIVAAIAAAVWEQGRIGAFSFAPWLAVLLLFVLAGVFAQGARMRADLEGTV